MLEELVCAHTKGGPMATLLWTNKSLRNPERGLSEKGYKASHRVVGEMFKMLGYGLQADKKTLAVAESHADRDDQSSFLSGCCSETEVSEQLSYINSQCKPAHAKGIPVISIDAKKRENIGNFKNKGRTYRQPDRGARP